MNFDKQPIFSVLENYDIGKFEHSIGQLESGFQSTNYHVKTTEGEFALRIIHDNPEDIEFGMIFHEYLANHGIKTPRPMHSKSGNLAFLHNENYYIVQTFIPG